MAGSATGSDVTGKVGLGWWVELKGGQEGS